MRIVVLGGGPGGYGAAFEAARLGAEVTLVERENLGGTCLNWGCVPTKTILRSARICRDTRLAADFGLRAEPAEVDIEGLMERKERVVTDLRAQLDSTARRLKVEVLWGEGRLAASHAVHVTDAQGGTAEVEGDAVILATGSVPFKLPGIDHSLEHVWTSDEAVSLVEMPERVVIIGGGVIGVEFACAYAGFGSAVDVVELLPAVLPGNDKRVSRTVQRSLEAMGIAFHLGTSVESVEERGGGIQARLADGTVLESDIVLSAVGRKPNSESFGFSEAGIEMDRAAVRVDGHLRTNVKGIYAVGDLIGGMMLAHVAEEEGVVAARNAVAETRAAKEGRWPDLGTVLYERIPACVYTFPEVAVVGWSRDSASERGIDAVQSVAKFAGNGRALAEGEAEGFVQLVVEKGSGRIIGCQIVGPHAVETIHEVAVAMYRDVRAHELAEMVHAHPTVSEVVKAAAADAAGKTG